jgi:hypothetical protein
LKVRFGEQAFSACDVMIKDIQVEPRNPLPPSSSSSSSSSSFASPFVSGQPSSARPNHSILRSSSVRRALVMQGITHHASLIPHITVSGFELRCAGAVVRVLAEGSFGSCGRGGFGCSAASQTAAGGGRVHGAGCLSCVTHHTSHVTRHTSHVTPHTSHVTRHTSHLTPHTSHLTPHTLSTVQDTQATPQLEVETRCRRSKHHVHHGGWQGGAAASAATARHHAPPASGLPCCHSC